MRPRKPATATSRQSTADLTAAGTQIAQLKAALGEARKPVAPAYPDLSGRVHELETQANDLQTALATRGVAPAYPDLSAKVRELESAVADSARQLVAAGTAQSELQHKLDESATALQTAGRGGEESAQLRRERDELSSRLTGLAGEVAQLRGDRERMQKMLADAGKQMRDSAADASRIKELETQAGASQSALTAAQAEVGSLQAALAAKPAPPAYPDLSAQVRELEAQVSAGSSAVAAAKEEAARATREVAALTKANEDARHGSTLSYPDLSGRVAELETTLADAKRQLSDAQTALHSAEPAKPVAVTSEADAADLQKRLAETEDKLATSLRGYAMLEHERDIAAANSSKSAETMAAEKNALAAQVAALSTELEQLKADARNQAGATQAESVRLNEELTALQHSSAQTTRDLATARALAQQLQGANSVLAGGKTTSSRPCSPARPVRPPREASRRLSRRRPPWPRVPMWSRAAIRSPASASAITARRTAGRKSTMPIATSSATTACCAWALSCAFHKTGRQTCNPAVASQRARNPIADGRSFPRIHRHGRHGPQHGRALAEGRAHFACLQPHQKQGAGLA